MSLARANVAFGAVSINDVFMQSTGLRARFRSSAGIIPARVRLLPQPGGLNRGAQVGVVTPEAEFAFDETRVGDEHRRVARPARCGRHAAVPARHFPRPEERTSDLPSRGP